MIRLQISIPIWNKARTRMCGPIAGELILVPSPVDPDIGVIDEVLLECRRQVGARWVDEWETLTSDHPLYSYVRDELEASQAVIAAAWTQYRREQSSRPIQLTERSSRIAVDLFPSFDALFKEPAPDTDGAIVLKDALDDIARNAPAFQPASWETEDCRDTFIARRMHSAFEQGVNRGLWEQAQIARSALTKLAEAA